MLRTSLLTLGLLSLIGCGQKGPLILEKLPTEATQQPLQNTPDEVPVVSEEEIEEESQEENE